MDAKMGRPHLSKAKNRGYVEYDPYIEMRDRTKQRGQHGLMDIRAEVARSAYDVGMLNDPIIQTIVKK